MKKIKLLILDDDTTNLYLMREIFQEEGFTVFTETNGNSGLSLIHKNEIDIILTDIQMPEMDGRVFIRKAKERFPHITIYAFSAIHRTDVIVQAIQAGAHDFIKKPFDNISGLLEILKVEAENIRERKRIETQIEKPIYFKGNSIHSRHIRKQKIIAAKNDFNILILGETGTGKELVAKGIHTRSSRKDRPFVVVNCAAIPESLIESEFFGFEKGAFTGANRRYRGRFEQANEGTLFLDEIGDMPVLLQTRLLRFLQEKEVTPIGQEKTVRADVRVIAATHSDLQEKIEKGEFREDLYHRLNELPIYIPPLRKRPDDIEELAYYFFHTINSKMNKKKRGISVDSIASLMKYSFPGNVRELQNLIKMSLAKSPDTETELTILLSHQKNELSQKTEEDILPLNHTIQQYCQKILEKTGNNILRTSKKLGISRNRLKKILNR